MKVLVADRFEQSGLDGLAAAGCEVVYEPDLAEATLVRTLQTGLPDVLVVRSTKVTGAMFDAGSLSLVVRAGSGVNTIDVAAASKQGIYVANCPAKNAIAVAELAIGLILALDRRIPDNVGELRAGRWNKREFSKARGLHGRTLGLLGFGSIGQEVARRARAFGMPVLVWSRRFAAGTPAVPPEITILPSPEEVAARADVLSVHLALTAETKGFVGRSILSRLKPGSFFINTARAEIVDAGALADTIRMSGIRAGLDVFPGEPPGATGEVRDPLLELPHVYGTHHIGASTAQAQEAIAAEAVRVVRTYKETGRAPNVVNLSSGTPATHVLIVRHRDRPGVLADVFDHLRAGHINVQEMENIVFDGAAAAVARINVDPVPPESLVRAIEQGNEHILRIDLVKK